MCRKLLLVAIIAGFLAACSSGADPERPPGVPASARWTGNVEGGTWIDCEPLPATANRYVCRAWFRTGAMISEGEYVHRQRRWNQQALRSEYTEPLGTVLPGFATFDGRWIMLEDEQVLLPDGVISYPDGAGHGKRQTYSLGVETGAAVVYPEP
jgi:hypothetical protein